MKLTELVTTAKGRKATAKLAWDLGKITGKVAVAGSASLVGAFVGAMGNTEPDNESQEPVYSNDIGADGPGEYDQMGFKVQNGNDWLD